MSTMSMPFFPRQHSPPSQMWDVNPSCASLLESGEAAHGECIFSQDTLVDRISGLRKLQRAAAAEAILNLSKPNDTTSPNPDQQRDFRAQRKGNNVDGAPVRPFDPMVVKLLPVERFPEYKLKSKSRNGCANIKGNYTENLLDNKCNVYLEPQRRDKLLLQKVGAVGIPVTPNDERSRSQGLESREHLLSRSIAYGTIETTSSVMRKSEEQNLKKSTPITDISTTKGKRTDKMKRATSYVNNSLVSGSLEGKRYNRRRSKSASFATTIIDSVNGLQRKKSNQFIPQARLTGNVAQPCTSMTPELDVISPRHKQATYIDPYLILKSFLTSLESSSHSQQLEVEDKSTILGVLNFWLPWGRHADLPNITSHNAEGALRELLRSASHETKGKSVLLQT
ncbi:unnamed protein product [Blumeria hordei]|uniref:Uncharacterized protein n=1 Tax=Blumeria hordei TaxID=2867405 RepID=A0A383UJ69_BLUHO|nr:unnamed protein product [Blumeria hordei]